MTTSSRRRYRGFLTLVAAVFLAVALVACSDDGPPAGTTYVGLADPRSIVPAAGSLWVLDGDSSEVVRIDPTTNQEIARVPIEISKPSSLLVAGDVIWVIGSSEMSRIDTATNTLALTTEQAKLNVAFGDGRLFANDGEKLYELDPLTAGEIGVVDVDVNAVLDAPMLVVDGVIWLSVFDGGSPQFARYSLAGSSTEILGTLDEPGALASTGDALWALGRHRDVNGYDLVTGEDRQGSPPRMGQGTILDEVPSGMVVAEDGTMWALGQPEQVLYQLDPETGEVIGSLALEFRPSSVVADGNTLWINNPFDNKLTRLDRSKLELELAS